MRNNKRISRNSDQELYEDNWLEQLEKQLNKVAVQPARIDNSLYNQITSIMNGKPKYTSVEAAVEDMKERSGLTSYLSNLNKQSSDTDNKDKIAATLNKINKYVNDELKKKAQQTPSVIEKHPAIGSTIQNYIRNTRGNLPIPAIIEKVRSIHSSDVSDLRDWDDENLIKYISRLNLQEKANNPETYKNHRNLGIYDPSLDSEIDSSNSDAFNALNTYKS